MWKNNNADSRDKDDLEKQITEIRSYILLLNTNRAKRAVNNLINKIKFMTISL